MVGNLESHAIAIKHFGLWQPHVRSFFNEWPTIKGVVPKCSQALTLKLSLVLP